MSTGDNAAHGAWIETRGQERSKQTGIEEKLWTGVCAREILDDLLEKHATDGELQFTLPDMLKVPPISQHGNVAEIIGKFGGADQFRAAVNELQTLLYPA